MTILNCYTDGSFNGKNASWAFIIIDNNKIIHQDKGIITDPEILTGRQVGGETTAVIKSLEWAASNQVKLKIHVDYLGLICWINDLWSEKPWKTNKQYTVEYRKKVLELREHLDSMVKIKSHSGVLHNELVDQLAKI
jgi:ribonuclease HI